MTARTPHERVSALNAYQARRVAATFTHVEDLLENIDRLAHSQTTALSREHLDLSETEGRLLTSLGDTARRRILETLDHLGLPRPTANLSARWSIETSLSFVDIALSELNTDTMRGYGAIDADTAAELGAVVSELRDVVKRGRALLRPREGEGLRDRLKSIEGPIGIVLQEMEAFSTEHGLIEVRPLIAAAAERVTASAIEIGIFGRVSAGKSSLINALVAAPILPVGATPVTAVPLRLVHGPDQCRVFFADGHNEVIDLNSLATFATESENRDNVRGVSSVRIQTPSLPDGLALLDTPGVGSLSQSGPAQAFAWLPRCDLGIVLVAAGTPLGRDELTLISGLTHAGIAVQVLLSKSDLIPAAERHSAIEYIKAEAKRASGSDALPVRAVSILGENRALLEQWRDEQLTPMIAARRQVAMTARARRIRALLGAMNAAVMGRPALDRGTVDLHRVRIQATQEITAAADALEASARATLTAAEAAAIAAWRARADAHAAVRQALVAPPTVALARTRAAADALLKAAAVTDIDDAAVRLPPLFDPSWLDALPIAQTPSLFGRIAPRAVAHGDLAALAKQVDDAFGTYAQRVRAWGLERVNEYFSRLIASREAEPETIAPALKSIAMLVEQFFPATR